MVSNLTFCFVECEEQPELVIALKTYITTTGQWDWATSDGEGSVDNALHIGYCEYSFNSTNIYPLIYMYSFDQIGTISASDYMENNVHYIEVVVDTYSDDWLFMDSYLYVGTLAGYNEYLTLGSNGKYITDFVSFPFQEDELSGIRVFKIPFTEITE